MISIIVPVYNAKLYLNTCINSVLAQNNKSWELLLIDDGSNDGSSSICDEYALKDSRIKVYHKINGGVSSARNLGLNSAKGEWIHFLDADDYISDDFLNIPPKCNDCDVIQKSVNIINGEIVNSRKICPKILHRRNDIDSFFVNHRTNALWDKIIKRSIIDKSRFDENIKVGEDLIFFLSFIKKINKYAFSNIGIYYYRVHTNSVMQSLNIIKELDVAEVNMGKVVELAKNNVINDQMKSCLIYGFYFHYFYVHRKLLSNNQKIILINLTRDIPTKELFILNFKAKIKLYIRILHCRIIQIIHMYVKEG